MSLKSLQDLLESRTSASSTKGQEPERASCRGKNVSTQSLGIKFSLPVKCLLRLKFDSGLTIFMRVLVGLAL